MKRGLDRVVGVRLEARDAEGLEMVAADEGVSTSVIIRRAILAELARLCPAPTWMEMDDALESLVRDGLIQRGVDGRYRITAKGWGRGVRSSDLNNLKEPRN